MNELRSGALYRNKQRLLQFSLLALAVAAAAVGGFLYRTELHAVVEVVLNHLRVAGPLIFFEAMAVLPAFGFPLLPFALTAGPAFGPDMGAGNVAICAIAAVATNVALSYWLAKSVFGPILRHWLLKLGYALPELPSGSDWQVVLAVRIAPGLPFWVQSYLLGLMRVAWAPYMALSTLVPSFYLTGVIVFGAAIWQGRGRVALLAAAVVGLVAAFLTIWRKRKRAASA